MAGAIYNIQATPTVPNFQEKQQRMKKCRRPDLKSNQQVFQNKHTLINTGILKARANIEKKHSL